MKLMELLEKGLIKEQPVDPEEIRGSIILAERFFDRANGNLEINFYDVAFLLSYTSMFHAARALLFKAGYKERTHFAIIEALRETYKSDGEIQDFLNVLDNYRLTRHAIQYNGELSNELDAVQSLKDAEIFITLVKRKLKL
jgi:uncharacterized protein (UPF0332 family)